MNILNLILIAGTLLSTAQIALAQSSADLNTKRNLQNSVFEQQLRVSNDGPSTRNPGSVNDFQNVLCATEGSQFCSDGVREDAIALDDPRRVTLGRGYIVNNDVLGDGEDRWRTNSFQISILTGPEGAGILPDTPGNLWEFRIAAEMIAPEKLNGPDSKDRVFAGVLTFGLHTHYAVGRAEITNGLDIVFTGPQTGLADLQRYIHEQTNSPRFDEAVEENQVPDGIYPTFVSEAGISLRGSNRSPFVWRQFISGSVGVESYVRTGFDITYAFANDTSLRVRDNVTGFRYFTAGVRTGLPDIHFIAGADYGYVFSSEYFPKRFEAKLENLRIRARAGFNINVVDRLSVFYGATYLSKEYKDQEESQVVGSLNVEFNF